MSEVSRWMPVSACSTACLADRGGSRSHPCHVLVDPLRVYSNPGEPVDATRQELSCLTRPTENERKYQ